MPQLRGSDRNYHPQVHQTEIVESSNSHSNFGDAFLGLMSLMEEGKVGAPFCFGDCSSDGLDHKRINGTIEILPSQSCDGAKVLCNADMITITSASYVLLKSIDQNLADAVSDVSG